MDANFKNASHEFFHYSANDAGGTKFKRERNVCQPGFLSKHSEQSTKLRRLHLHLGRRVTVIFLPCV